MMRVMIAVMTMSIMVKMMANALMITQFTMILTVKKVKFKTCYLIILQNNGPGNVNYDRFVLKKLRFQFFLKMIVKLDLMMRVTIAVMTMLIMVKMMANAIRITELTMILTVKKVKFETCYLIILQDNGPGNVNYDRFVKKTYDFNFFEDDRKNTSDNDSDDVTIHDLTQNKSSDNDICEDFIDNDTHSQKGKI